MLAWGHGDKGHTLEAQRLGGTERYSAKVQTGAELLCKGAKVKLSKG